MWAIDGGMKWHGPDREKYLGIYLQYGPLGKLLTQDASEKVRQGNYERILDEARRKGALVGISARKVIPINTLAKLVLP